MRENFLVTSREDMKRRGWDQLDFVYINGDAYVDSPLVCRSLIGRVLESRGYRVGLISQPDWHSADAFKALGRPRLAALITAGNLDSMLNEKTAARKFRSRDSYSPGGETGHRPERATIVYANRMREAYKDVPIIIGGIEASLRRFAHYDYWSNKVRHSILLDSKADILSYGMGEHSIVEIADALAEGKSVAEMYDIRGICYVTGKPPVFGQDRRLPHLMKRSGMIRRPLPRPLRCSMKSRILFTARPSSSRRKTASSSRRRRPCPCRRKRWMPFTNCPSSAAGIPITMLPAGFRPCRKYSSA